MKKDKEPQFDDVLKRMLSTPPKPREKKTGEKKKTSKKKN